jgi:glycosyltransferase involved in cell wall biosynthesis
MRFPGTISAILPAHNEERNVRVALRQAQETLAATTLDYEIVVVDDGSADDTAGVVEREAIANPRVRLIRHPRNLGYGAALKSGLRAARNEAIFFTDADLQFDLSEFSKLAPWLQTFDIVAGYRVRRRDNWGRRVNAWGWKILIRALFGLRVRDVDCAFKLFRRRVIDSISVDSLGAFVNTEILLRAQRLGFTLKEIPVTHYPRTQGRASGARPGVIYRAFRELSRMRRELRP